MSKRDLRIQMKKKLSSMDKKTHAEKSSALSKNLHTLLDDLHVIQNQMIIGTFAPFESEPIWFQELHNDFHELTAYPVFETNVMTFKLAPHGELEVRKDFGVEIHGPSEKAIEVEPQILLIPGLAFTERGERLGRGKGFYDRFMSQFRGIKIGLCFEVQLLNELPTEEHDVTLDYIVTEEKIINCSRPK